MYPLPISLIIPTLNRGFLLKYTLPLYLRLPVKEVILCDDGSTDNTGEIAKKLACNKLIYHKSSHTKGQAAMRNIGIQAARNDWILMGEDDVTMNADYVVCLFSNAQKLCADMVAGRLIAMRYLETVEDARARSDMEGKRAFFFEHSLTNDFSCVFPAPVATPHLHACALLQRTWALRFPYDEEYGGNGLREETDFYFRSFQGGAKMYFCSDAVAYHMFHNYGGGSRRNHLWYAYHSLINNHRFLNKHWTFIKKYTNCNHIRTLFEIRLQWKFVRMTFLFWLNAKMPNFHAFLKDSLIKSVE